MIRKSRAAAGLAVAALGALAAAPAMANGADAAAPAKITTSAGTKAGSVQATRAADNPTEPDPDDFFVEVDANDEPDPDADMGEKEHKGRKPAPGEAFVAARHKKDWVMAVYVKDRASGDFVLEVPGKGPLASLPKRTSSMDDLGESMHRDGIDLEILAFG